MFQRSIRPALRLLALAGAAATMQAQAVQVSVSVGGLPPGLSPQVEIRRNVCSDGMGFATNPSVPLTETSRTVFEMVTLAGGIQTLRSRVITTYVASFATVATGDPGTPSYEVQCSRLGQPDQFYFSIRIPGQNAADQAVSATGSLGTTPQTGPITINQTLSARTTSFTPTVSVLTRGVAQSLDAAFSSPIGAVQGQRLDFLRPSTLIPGMFTRVASVFVRSSDNAACVQAGSTTQCQTGTTPVEAGGVRLHSLQRTVSGQPGLSRFRFELTNAFPVGTLKLRAAADAADLAAYLVDGTPQALDLLPWAPAEQTVTVQ